jgi:hypothetical protein
MRCSWSLHRLLHFGVSDCAFSCFLLNDLPVPSTPVPSAMNSRSVAEMYHSAVALDTWGR